MDGTSVQDVTSKAAKVAGETADFAKSVNFEKLPDQVKGSAGEFWAGIDNKPVFVCVPPFHIVHCWNAYQPRLGLVHDLLKVLFV